MQRHDRLDLVALRGHLDVNPVRIVTVAADRAEPPIAPKPVWRFISGPLP
jgi:hypothetical protein